MPLMAGEHWGIGWIKRNDYDLAAEGKTGQILDLDALQRPVS